jgi:hypothetical protein
MDVIDILREHVLTHAATVIDVVRARAEEARQNSDPRDMAQLRQVSRGMQIGQFQCPVNYSTSALGTMAAYCFGAVREACLGH